MDETRRPSINALSTLKYPAARTAGVVVGAVLGGPGGAAVGAISVEALSAADKVGTRRSKAQKLRRGQLLELSAQYAGITVEQLVDELARNPQLQELAGRLMDAAAESAWRSKLVALARQVAWQAQPDQEEMVAVGAVFGRAMEALEIPHVRVLARLDSQGDSDRHGVDHQDLRTALPALATVMDALIAVLQLHGLIFDRARGYWEGAEGRSRWAITDMGRTVLTLLREAGEVVREAGLVDEPDV